MATLSNLSEAWDRWDTSPGDPAAARRMIDATKVVAAELGVPYVTVRRQMQALRRQGLSRSDVLHRIATRLQQ